jgi:glutamate/aspartate transport system ATP-binding protein
MEDEPTIFIRAVSKWYGTFQALTDCSTDIGNGEVVVVCGPSGCGRSTLIKCVNGRTLPAGGHRRRQHLCR